MSNSGQLGERTLTVLRMVSQAGDDGITRLAIEELKGCAAKSPLQVLLRLKCIDRELERDPLLRSVRHVYRITRAGLSMLRTAANEEPQAFPTPPRTDSKLSGQYRPPMWSVRAGAGEVRREQAS